MASTTALALALAVRVSIALITRTFFQPDEYFQALEPAHFFVFGYGDLTWEWTSKPPIRSILYPALNVPIYWVLKILNLDQTSLLVAAPKVMHGLLAAGTDIWVREVARKTLGQRYVPATFFLSLTSFFHALSLSRSMSNSLEATLTTAALGYYPWDATILPTRSQLRKFLVFIALACSIRVTNAITWVFLFPPLLWQLRRNSALLRVFVTDTLATICVTLSLLFTFDSMYSGAPTLTPLNFLRVNASSVSLFYGSAPWHYYLVQALPLLAGPALPFVLHGAYLALTQGPRPLKLLLHTVIWTGAVFSFAGHKEWRFLHPLVPAMHILAARSLVSLYDRASPPCSSKPASSLGIKRTHASVLALLSLVPALYAALWHSSAQIGVLSHLRGLPDTELRSIGFLMPCHSTPAQSHLHRRIPVWRLSCEPPLHGEELSTYQDETDIFFRDPVAFLSAHFPDQVDTTFPPSARAPHEYAWPTHLVLFGALLRERGVEDALRAKGYTEAWRAGNGIEEDPRRREGVRIWRRGVAADKISI
ncbi:Alg9-like mannosyltransferase family-domain-containing protein [Lactarius akahatsu]|uniref:Mannosyltransferase n=1 Tax=Lactarius akahatsu TaxID=416441 RepID=A0AAD4Q3G9_9AGAM|nr:Alg9-like mannosyltransferase family-domain-containing protein [Lactarius akahatsu]